jgi:hypothetical protein
LSSRGRKSSGPEEVGQAELTAGGGGAEGEELPRRRWPDLLRRVGGGGRRPRFVRGRAYAGAGTKRIDEATRTEVGWAEGAAVRGGAGAGAQRRRR